MIYYITFIFIISLLFLHNKIDKKIAFYFICFWFILFAGFRYEIGFDYDNYRLLYNDYISYKENFTIEPLIKFLFLFTYYYFFDFYGFIFLIALSSVIIKFKFLDKYSQLPLLSILLYFSRIFLIFDFGQIRQGLALGIVLWASIYIIERKLKHFIFFMFISATIHVSSLVFFPMYFIAKNIFNNKTYLFLLLLSSSMLFFDLKQIIINISFLPKFIETKLLFYTELEAGDQIGFNFSSLFRISIIFIILFFKKNILKSKFDILFFNIYFFGIIFFFIFQSLPQLGGRGSMYFQQFELLLIPIIIVNIKSLYLKFLSFFLLFLYSFWGIYSTINFQDELFQSYKTIFF